MLILSWEHNSQGPSGQNRGLPGPKGGTGFVASPRLSLSNQGDYSGTTPLRAALPRQRPGRSRRTSGRGFANSRRRGKPREHVLGGVQSHTDPPFLALRDALQVRTDADYSTLAARWPQQTEAWATPNPARVNATIAFRLRDEAARPINDSWVLLQDPMGSASAMSGSLLQNQPIQNQTEHCAISFYVNYAQFAKFPSHKVQIEAHSGSPSIAYQQVTYASAPGAQFVHPNEFTYVDVAIPRDVEHTYAIVPFSAGPDPNKRWPPVPQI